jgi:S1-C subfamily serine protease
MTSLAPLVETVLPAVLVLEVNEGAPPIPSEMREFFSLPDAQKGEGSGFLVSPEGLALTNAHVVAGAVEVHARMYDGTRVPVQVLGVDADTDIALIALPSDRAWPYLELGGSTELRLGDWVVAIGNPLGLGHTVTAGIVSGKGRILGQDVFGSDDYIQTDAAINQGNSGGPIFALDGRVVGVANAVIAGANTVGFAIPSELATNVFHQLRDHGRVVRGFIGVRPEPLTPQRATLLGVDIESGAVVGVVFDGTPADAGGLLAGDVVVAIDDEAVRGPSDLVAHIGSRRPGEVVRVRLLRGSRERTLKVTLAERPKD